MLLATGLDQIPAWFLKITAPLFCKPLANLFNLSIVTSTVLAQWKAAYICLASKVASPHFHADFWPISIMPVLSRILEKNSCKTFSLPLLYLPTTRLKFQRSVRFLTHRLHNSCAQFYFAHGYEAFDHTPVCSCHSAQLQEGFWQRAPKYPSE